MSNRNSPINNLTPLAISYLFATLDNNGRQFTGGILSPGDIAIVEQTVDGYIPAGKYSISHSKHGKKTTKVVNVFELTDGTWLYSTPFYKLRKVNGTTQRSVDDSKIVYPSNALAVYQVTVSWEEELTLDAIHLDIVKYVQNRF